MLNKTQLIGYIGRINETKIIGGGTKVASFSLATNKKYKSADGEWNTRTQWHAVQCWGKLADTAEVYIKKGSLVYIEGELDYGIMLGGGFAITEQIGVNVGYYIGLAEFDEMMKFNGLIFNLGYNF